ncbi:MAG: hypothetical protein HYU36_18320 [Planctomycetes bacterium]|nr:hypothetical protein [Planctomycetota bacterium]
MIQNHFIRTRHGHIGAMLLLCSCSCERLAPAETGPVDDGVHGAAGGFSHLAQAEPADTPVRRNPGSVRMVQVILERVEVDSLDREAFEIALRYRDRRVAVSAGALGGRNGLILLAVNSNLAAALGAEKFHQKSRQVSQQFLMVSEGGRASFDIVQVGKVAWSVRFPVFNGDLTVTTIEERITGTGLAVKVHGASEDFVDLELFPYLRKAGKGGLLEISELRTRVSVIPGQSYLLMSQRDNNSSAASALFSCQKEGQVREIFQTLTVQLP